jgi:tetratricopeptide (TPR) repeat protein
VIALLDQEKLQASREQTQQATAAIKKEKALLVVREEQNQQQIQQLIETFTLKADALTLAFRYAEVATQYRAIIGIHVENELPSTDLAGWYDKLGQVLLDNGTYPPALEAYQKALAIREEVLEAKHPDLVIS